MSPLVSVVIPAFNGERFIEAAIESVLAQSYRPLEVIVVDDGSTDSTPAIVRRFGQLVHYIRQANAGTAAARNTGASAAKGEFIALLDQDDLWMPDMLQREMPLFEQNPCIGLVFAGVDGYRPGSRGVRARRRARFP